ncbi:hypothetical protein LZZ85_13225 [Terrimonas sp. NA20]|uniref:Uncharacterized protein n=1 Tax=Terrimonas ginsenosidimutans TaxID=2908004 RepID=A0ABS9KSE5_9BACT|nr:hypothetical protein [Terrimonas ginsenosidimutans]MCG2615256.1 hypothetical protein [Terrimonas ginsenosidimutans]
MKEFTFNQVYKIASTIEDGIDFGVPLIFHTTKQQRITLRQPAMVFNRHTLLHHYIRKCFLHHYDHYFLRMAETVIEDVVELTFLEDQFSQYGIPIDFLRIKYNEQDYPATTELTVINWYRRNRKNFILLTDRLYEEIFFILFSNRNLLQKFNAVIAKNFQEFHFKQADLTIGGKIRRTAIPA